jgi:glycosyltransferase involved in cell wall biosynthesis
MPKLSIVAPVHNEAEVIEEFVARCAKAAQTRSLSFEIVIVDDASTDQTPALLAGLSSEPRLRTIRLSPNAGQAGATKAGLREARGDWILVLDSDLQDPPERIPDLIDTLSSAPASVGAVLAVKSRRDDPPLFMAGQFLFHRFQHLFSRVGIPSGAGSYCILRREVAERVAVAELGHVNLSALVAVAAHASGKALATVSYEKAARYDGQGRVGWRRLVIEALQSLAATGALARILGLAALALLAGGLAASSWPRGRGYLLGAAGLAAGASVATALITRRALAKVRAAEGAGP